MVETATEISGQGISGEAKSHFARPEYITLLILVVFQTFLIVSSDGFHIVDEGNHFVNNVRALSDPSVSIGIWQRFGRVWLYALPAQLGHKAVKVLASLLFLLSIYVTYKVAEAKRIPGKEWIVFLVGFQPIFLDISYSCFAELPAALLLVVSYLLYTKGRWNLSLLSASLVFLFRFEMSIVALILFVLAIREKKYAALPFALVGPLVWYSFSWALTGDPLRLIRDFAAYSRYPKYIEGAAMDHYITSAAEVFGVVQVGLLAVFLLFDLFDKRVRLPFVSFTVLFCIVLNSLAASKEMHWTGSVGDLRYLAPIAPFVGILALSGMSSLLGSLKSPVAVKLVPPILAGIAVLSSVTTVQPHHLTPLDKGVMKLSVEAAANSANVPILANHWAASFALMGDGSKMKRIMELSQNTYASHPEAYILWDPLIANSAFSQHQLTLETVRNSPNVSVVDSLVVQGQTVYLFRQRADRKP